MNVKEIKKLMEILNSTDLSELSMEVDGTKVSMKKDKNAAFEYAEPALEAVETETAPVEEIIEIKSANVGKYYINDKSGKPLVSIGDTVKKDQLLGYVETIGIKNEVKAADGGTIKEIKVAEGGIAEFGQILLTIIK